MTQIWAHRGSRLRAAENTLEAFALAIEEGADGIELDVHLSADSQLVVRHDPTVQVNGKAVALGALDYAHILAACPEDERPPLLEEVYSLLAPTSMSLNIEAKTGDAAYPGIVKALVSTWHASGLGDKVVFSSFNHHTLKELGTHVDNALLAPLIADGLLDVGTYAAHHGFTAVHLFAPLALFPGVSENCHDNGIEIRAWTVNDAAQAQALVAKGVHTLITDDPVSVRSSLEVTR